MDFEKKNTERENQQQKVLNKHVEVYKGSDFK